MSAFLRLRTDFSRFLPTDVLPIDKDVEAEKKATEKRLGVKMPDVLIDYHRILGSSTKLNDAYNHVLSLNELYLSNGGMIIVEERERYYLWGIMLEDLSEPNPAVMQKPSDEEAWVLFSDSLECFLANNACWQVLNLMAAIGTTKCTKEVLSELSSRMPSIATLGVRCSSSEDTISFIGKDVVCIVYPHQSILYVGGADDAAVSRFQVQFQLRLNWL